ncbi:hypothetical protein J1614_005282 [Plenodomus biglobosus]|nr:hypothetical protein J1614_005282 [Plenodomus biglobosus]
MDKEHNQPPPPEASVAPHTNAPPKRPRSDSGSSTSTESNRSVRTVTSEDLEYVHENGRTYGNDTYYLPCIYLPNEDFREQDRVSLQHRAFVYALQGKLTTTRLLPSTRRILDLGTGPGHWAVGMAQQYPDAEVVGIDLTQWDIDTTEATMGDSRVTWELDDLDVWGKETDIDDLLARLAEHDFFADTTNRDPLGSPTQSRSRAGTDIRCPSESSVQNLTIDLSTLEPQPEPGWHFSAPFELIHMRNMKGAFTHWEEVYAEIHKSLSPGGWIEVADYDLGNVPAPPEEPDSSSYTMVNVRKLYAALMQASYKSGRPLGLFYMHPSYLEEAGFTDIQTTHVNVPIGPWGEDETQRSIGKIMLFVVLESMESILLRPLTKYGDNEKIWTAEEVHTTIAAAQQEVTNWCARAERGEVSGWCASFKWITGRKSWHAT